VPHYRLERDLLDQGMRLDRGLMSRYVEHAGNTLGATIVAAMRRDAIVDANSGNDVSGRMETIVLPFVRKTDAMVMAAALRQCWVRPTRWPHGTLQVARG